MAHKRDQAPVHSVTLQFIGPKAEEMANHFFINWLDGGLDQIWEGALSDADIAESIAYDWDPQTKTFVIEAVVDDEDGPNEDEEDDEDEDLDDDEDEDEEETVRT